LSRHAVNANASKDKAPKTTPHGLGSMTGALAVDAGMRFYAVQKSTPVVVSLPLISMLSSNGTDT